VYIECTVTKTLSRALEHQPPEKQCSQFQMITLRQEVH
jgi:hypothetical protein